MANYPIPLTERQRLEELSRYAILDSPPEECFDQLTLLAAHICQVPIALISFVDRDRQWFKSAQGLDTQHTPRDQAFCAHTILGTDVLVVEDASADARFADNPLVRGAPGIRFYAGAPLTTPAGEALGSLCVIDREPRVLTGEQLRMLSVLAFQVVQQLELRRIAALLRQQSALLDKTQQTAQIGGWALDLATQSLSWTDETYRIHGLTPNDYSPTVESAIDWYAPTSRAIIRAAVDDALAHGTPYDLELQIVAKGGVTRWVRATGQLEEDRGQPRRLLGIFQNVTERRALETEILRIAQREQARIGATLHDELGQELTGMSYLLHSISEKIPAEDPILAADITQLTSLVRDAIGTCRSLAHGLSPTGRERGGLIAALQSLASRIQEIYALKVLVRSRGEDWDFDSFIAEHLYRIAQEAVTNALKHAKATQIIISIDISTARTILSITDNGASSSGNSYTASMGLQIMRYRARLIDASVAIENTVGGGTRVRCRRATSALADSQDLRPPLSGRPVL